ncbi:TPA: LPXTG cell wall anchor domain-containing protein, partial [Staphylococcus aureus]|nr:LPXTG cell wall anchor domain-containing protein [Staphylococcus aureus]HDJ2655002.1 LPXTG cell wall anchor domain-containing protein [Staphylococcus aureus]
DADADTDADADADADASNSQKSEKASQNKNNLEKTLPETGQDTMSTSLIGSGIAGLGSLMLFRRKRKNNE